MPRGLLSVVLCSIVVFAAGRVGATSLITNGGFETGDFTGWKLNFTPPNDAATVVDWADRVYEGNYGVNFSGESVPATAVIAQTFDTVNGAGYDVTFAFGTVAWTDRSPTLLVEVLGEDGATVLAARILSRPGLGLTEWTTELVSFTADGATATLRFTDQTSPSFASDALLDDVSVTGETCPRPSIRVSEVEICWDSRVDRLYQVDYRSDMTAGVWVPLATDIVGNGMTMCVPDKVPREELKRFYRVVCVMPQR